jgi:hypothetical protein
MLAISIASEPIRLYSAITIARDPIRSQASNAIQISDLAIPFARKQAMPSK